MNSSFCQLILSALCCVGLNVLGGEIIPAKMLSLWPGRTPAEARKMPGIPESVLRITDVTDPKLYLYPAEVEETHPAVMVCPGGGYNLLAMDLEGTEVATWLNSIGFTAVILEYTVPQDRDASLSDAQRAMGLIRQHSAEWGIDPEKLGVLGFSAGGHLSARLSTTWSERTYDAVDEADTLSCRPDFTVLIYPAYLGDENYQLTKEVVVNDRTPPAFTVQAQDDLPYVNSSIAYALALKAVGVPVEQHLYSAGGHGYGLRSSGHAVSSWPILCAGWLSRQIAK